MAKRNLLSFLVLYPVSKIYGWVMSVRNAMFNHGIVLKQKEFDIPIIVVGNLSMGGSGKTPHTEYIVESLCSKYNIGVLSRGYKRKTKGFVLAPEHSTPDTIGDEPYQIYRKFRERGVTVAVCENRVKGIEAMREANPSLNLLVLDDAFQHRYVKPTISVVLMERNRPAFLDHLLPFGRLREPMSALNRADIVVVTKCPKEMKPMDCRIFKERLELFKYQQHYFTGYNYEKPVPLFESAPSDPGLETPGPEDTILTVTGVANPKPFARYVRSFGAKFKIKRFSDHHHFTHSDMDSILEKFNSMPGRRKLLLTTEKDAVRLMNNPYFPHQLRKYAYYIPIKVDLMHSEGPDLKETIERMIRTSRALS